MQVLVGSMNAYTPNAVRYSREAEKLGADGLMIIPPYYYTPTEDEIFAYYQAICEKVSIPIMLYNNPFTSNVDMSAKLVGRLTRAFEQIRYIKEASQDMARVYDIVEETQGVMNVFAGERIVESYLYGAVGYVNPYGNYIPRASHRSSATSSPSGRFEDAKKIERLINKIYAIIHEGHPTYGHQCYSKALAAAAGYPVGDVRPPLTTFKELGEEGQERVKKVIAVMRELDAGRRPRFAQVGMRLPPSSASADVARAVDVERGAAQMPAGAAGEERHEVGDVARAAPIRPSRATP